MKDYYGWRARIGLIYPSAGTVMEPEFYAMAPEGVSIHTTRLHLEGATLSGLSEMVGEGNVERCTRELAEAPLHVIVFGGTSATFLEGLGWDQKICERMQRVSNRIPVTTTSTAVIKSLRVLGAKRVSFVTAYIDEVNERGRRFLEANGFEVMSCNGLGLVHDHDIAAVPTERVYEFTRKSVAAEADAVFISCTGLRTIGAIAPLEEDLGVPVVTSNQASFWDCLRLAGVGARTRGFGELFAH